MAPDALNPKSGNPGTLWKSGDTILNFSFLLKDKYGVPGIIPKDKYGVPGINGVPGITDRLDSQAVEQLSDTIEDLEPPWRKEMAVLAFLRDKALEQGTMADMVSPPV